MSRGRPPTTTTTTATKDTIYVTRDEHDRLRRRAEIGMWLLLVTVLQTTVLTALILVVAALW
jgi:hypothetical protein